MRNLVVLAMLMLVSGAAVPAGDGEQADFPSAALLEFLGDMPPLDDETWRLLEHHADKDIAENKEVDSE